jgi:alpha-ketoglutaric semialdehyde dehydrogenase
VLEYIRIGTKEAGQPLCGGERLTGIGPNGEDLSKGFFCAPTVFADVSNDMRIAQEEIFGPVLAIVRAKDFTDAMALANATPLGLAASVQTTNVSRVFEFVNQMEAGLLTVNLPSAGVEYSCHLEARRIRASAPRSRDRQHSSSTANTGRSI